MASVAFRVLVLLCVVGPAVSEHHSLYYIYTALSKNVELPGIYEFTALGLLDDREIDYYNSKDQVKTPKQDWMREKMQEDYWEKGTQSRKSKEQWFKVNVDILMQRMRHNQTDLHVLQWRHGCEIKEENGKPEFVRGIDEYSYDGKEFLSFDDENMRWVAPVAEAEPTKRKWDGVQILNQYTKGYLEKECVDWLTKFMDYGKESLRKHSPPDVHAFAKKSVIDPTKLTLTCLATGFYPKDVKLCVRKFRTSLPEHLLTSSGVRPNEDGTFQLRKSVDIPENEKADYDCYVSHSSLKEPVIIKWDHKCSNCGGGLGVAIGGALAGLILLIVAVIGVVIVIRKLRSMVPMPLELKVVKISTSILVEWKQAKRPLDGYTLSASPNQTNGSGSGSQMSLSGDGTSAQIDDLIPGCLYDISLVAERKGAQSKPAIVQATPVVPVPHNLRVVKTSSTSVTVEWEEAQHNIDGYTLSASPNQKNRPGIGNKEMKLPRGGTSAQIDDLMTDCLYNISLVAERKGVQSKPATVQATPVVPVPQDLRVIKTSSTSVAVRWKQGEDNIDGYILTATPKQMDGSDSGKIELKLSGRVNCYQIDGLVLDRLYNISLVAERNGARSKPATVHKTPGSTDSDSGKGSGSLNSSKESLKASSDSSSQNGRASGSLNSSKESLKTSSDSSSENGSSRCGSEQGSLVSLRNGQPEEEEEQSLLAKEGSSRCGSEQGSVVSLRNGQPEEEEEQSLLAKEEKKF